MLKHAILLFSAIGVLCFIRINRVEVEKFLSENKGCCYGIETSHVGMLLAIADVEDGEPVYAITLAGAGFTKKDIDISIEDGTLKIEGKTNTLDADDTVEFLHKGIAERNFTRTFKLADYVEVESAKLEDGILRVNLFRNVPEAMKPKTIDIS